MQNKSTTAEDNFFTRNNLSEAAERLCFGTALARFPGSVLIEPSSKGYCSYTLLNTTNQLVIQFRPEKHGIDLEMANLAREIHGTWAPVTKLLGSVSLNPRLDFYSHSLIPGKTLSEMAGPVGDCGGFVRELAVFFSRSYNHEKRDGKIKQGRIGSSLEDRLLRLKEGLPERFRGFVELVLAGLDGIVGLPWVLTHGDFNADNAIVKLESGGEKARGGWRSKGVEKSKRELRLKGVIDWAEAEFLPFGTGLYGLESILRHLDSLNPSDEQEGGGRVELRHVFWSELENLIPKLKTDEEFREMVKLAGLMGVLLWNGIAFDNGALDRVVEEEREGKEIEMLDDILFGGDGVDYLGLGSKKVEKSKN